MHLRATLAALTLTAASTGGAFATDYYVAPPGTVQSCTSDGSQACPWIGLDAAFTSGKLVGGDRLLLLDGNYGALQAYQLAFASEVVIQSLNGKNAHLDYVLLKDGTKNITLRNLSIWPTDPYQGITPIVETYTTASNIVLDGLDVRSGQDALNYMSWSQSEWTSRRADGIITYGPNNVVKNSSLTGIYMGAIISGPNSSLIGNQVEGFAGDAYRALADNILVSGNTAKNCFSIDTNHGDMLQSFADADGTISGLTVENNTFLEWATTQANPLHCTMQGIFLGDAKYSGVIIRNNLISVTLYHGLSIQGGQNVQILNNTVVNNKGIEGGAPWIGIFNNPDGTPVQNFLVANNLEMSFNDEAAGVTFVNNSTLVGLSSIFQNIGAFDYHPTATSGFIDTADTADAPPTDIVGASRPYGAGPDRGAYEVGSTPTTTTSGGTTTTTSGGGTTTSGGGTTTTTSGGGAKFIKSKKWK